MYIPSMPNPFFTVGHSTRPIEEFVALLATAEVRLVVDVRTVPRSRTNPQFNRDGLPASLAAQGITYEHFGVLGGLRGKQPGVNSDVNAFWKNASSPSTSHQNLSDARWRASVSAPQTMRHVGGGRNS
jgi:Protein of unknown function, DUF488